MKAPRPVIPAHLEMPPARLRTLKNGVQLYILQADEFEVVRLTLVFHAGSVTQCAPFVAGAAANLLAEGSERMSGRQIAEQLDFYGSYFEVNLDRDFIYISFCSLRKYYRELLDAAGEILLRPRFPEEEVRSYCLKRQQQLAIERTKVDTLAREELAASLFGDEHPYGVRYPEAAYAELRRGQIVDHYRRLYTAGNCMAVCSGHVGPAEEELTAALIEQLPAGEAPALHFPAPVSRPFRHIERPEALQSAIRMGRRLFTRPHPDFVGMQMVATLLGGYFGSRLMQNLREEHGYTYGVMASMVNLDREGYLAIATQVGAETTHEALNEIYREIERLRTEPVGEEELTLARNILTGEMLRILDGPFGIADVAIENLLSGQDSGVIDRNLQEIRAITPERIRELAQRYIAPSDLTVVVAGR